MAEKSRIHRVESELKKLLSTVLRSKINNIKLSMVTIIEIEVSKDLSHAKVYYSCLIQDDLDYISTSFQKSKGLFRSHIANSLKLRIVPNLEFIYDDSLEYGIKMETKINQALYEDSRLINQDNKSLIENYKNSEDKDSSVEKLR